MHRHAYALPHWLWIATVLAIAAAAILWGRRDERLAAAGLVVGWLLTVLAYAHHGAQTEWGILAVDIGLLGVLTWIALSTEHYWPIFAASFQLLAVVIHLARLADRSLGGWAYISAEIIFGYWLAAAIAAGVYRRWRERRTPAPQAVSDTCRSAPWPAPGTTRR